MHNKKTKINKVDSDVQLIANATEYMKDYIPATVLVGLIALLVDHRARNCDRISPICDLHCNFSFCQLEKQE